MLVSLVLFPSWCKPCFNTVFVEQGNYSDMIYPEWGTPVSAIPGIPWVRVPGESLYWGFALIAINWLFTVKIPVPRYCGISDKKAVNQWAFSGEKLIHGTPSGIDNAVSTYGNILLYKDGKITTHDSANNLDILLVNTHVPRNTKVTGLFSDICECFLVIWLMSIASCGCCFCCCFWTWLCCYIIVWGSIPSSWYCIFSLNKVECRYFEWVISI